MIKRPNKAFGVYHWDTFDNETFLIAEADSVEEANALVKEHYGNRIRPSGADVVEIVTKKGGIVARFNVG